MPFNSQRPNIFRSPPSPGRQDYAVGNYFLHILLIDHEKQCLHGYRSNKVLAQSAEWQVTMHCILSPSLSSSGAIAEAGIICNIIIDSEQHSINETRSRRSELAFEKKQSDINDSV